MRQRTCEREPSVVAQVRSGVWSADLKDHIAACATCAETMRVAQQFQRSAQHAAKIAAQTPPPPANIVWQKVRARRQKLALRRATQCVTVMSILAALYAVVLTAWCLPRLWHMQPSQVETSLSTLSSGTVFAGVLTAILAVFLGSCCLAFLGSRTNFRLRS
jgi:predicted anti-sigma-YlaC factor YlaD